MAVEMRYGDYVKESFEVVKANLGPSVVMALVMAIPVLGWVAIFNWLAMFKAARAEGKPMDIGGLFNFENAADKIITLLLLCCGYMCCVVPGMLIAFAPCIIADKPGTPAMSAVKAALEFGKANVVPMIVLGLVVAIVQSLGSVACGVGILITMPIAQGALFLAYEDQRAAVEAAAAQGGVSL